MSDIKHLNFDFHFYKDSIIALLLVFGFYIIGNYIIPLYHNHFHEILEITELFQLIMILYIMIYTYFHTKSIDNKSNRYKFWLWALLWWLLILGRSISWGRDFFPEVPKIYYRLISIILIMLPILTLFLSPIRNEIIRRWKYEKIPVWYVFLAFLFLGLASIAEQQYLGYSLLVKNVADKDLVEEFLEIPCFLSLIAVTRYLQKNDNKQKKYN